VERFRGRLGRHHGFALATSGAYVAACADGSPDGDVHWYGVSEFPPTEDGERAAVDEWEVLHARHLLTTTADTAVTRELAAILQRLDALAVESPVAMLSGLEVVRVRCQQLVELAVRNARGAGASWPVVAAQLGMSEAAVRRRFAVD